MPMAWLGEDDILSRAEAAARWAWRALLAAAAEDVRAILAGEALACKRRGTRPRGSAAGGAHKKQLRRVQRDHSATITPAHALSLTTAQQIEAALFSLTKPKQVLSQRKNCKRQTQAPVPLTHSRLHEFSRGDDCTRIGGGVPTSRTELARTNTSTRKCGQAKEQRKCTEQSHRQRRSCPRIANICGDAPCPLS